MGKGGQQFAVGPKPTDDATTKAAAPRKITLAEMKKHNTVSDAWMSIGTKVYDVSDWHEHPGGSVMFTHAGDDMTDTFNMFHPPGTKSMLKHFYVGDLIADEEEVAAMTP